MDIVDKITGDIYLATEFTSFKNESQNAIESTGQTLSASSDVQLAKALTISGQTAHSYQDSGSANAYVLTRTGSLEQPTSYIEGMRISFVTSNANTGASTVNVSGLGSKAIVKAGDIALSAGDISANTYMELIYDPAADSASGGFVVTSLQATKITYFTSSGTHTTAPGVRSIEFIATGGGGGGGGVEGQGVGTNASGAGGGAGATSIKNTNVINASYAIVIGAGGLGGAAGNNNGASGGTSTVISGAINISAGGGAGGVGMTGTSGAAGSSGGIGGTSTGGDINLGGAGGTTSTTANGDRGSLGASGSSFFGGGQEGRGSSGGVTGTAPGAGGTGSGALDLSTDFAGGDGADGIVIVKEYF